MGRTGTILFLIQGLTCINMHKNKYNIHLRFLHLDFLCMSFFIVEFSSMEKVTKNFNQHENKDVWLYKTLHPLQHLVTLLYEKYNTLQNTLYTFLILEKFTWTILFYKWNCYLHNTTIHILITYFSFLSFLAFCDNSWGCLPSFLRLNNKKFKAMKLIHVSEKWKL